jgi:hypothetical protein
MADAPAAAAVAEIVGVAAAAVAVIDIAAAAGIAAAAAAAGIAVDHDTAANCRDILCSPRPRRGMGRPQCSQDTRRRHSWRGTRCSRRRRTIHSQSC